jgi:hypothetical protein
MAEKMKIRVPDPKAGNLSEAIDENMDILESKEPQSEYVLEDGTKIKTKQAAINIVKLDLKNPDGTPVYVNDSIDVIFKEYYTKWYNETKYLSSPKMFENKHYRDIISLGISVVPSIIKKLRKEPVHLFEALTEITGHDPVPESHWGDGEQMALDWISWWEEKERVQNLFSLPQ